MTLDSNSRTAALRTAVLILLGTMVVAAVSWPAIGAFVADDDDSWLAWCSRPFGEVVRPDGAPHATSRPGFVLWMAVEQRLFGDRLGGYRLVGLAVHAAASCLLAGIARPMLGAARAAAAGLLFLVIPVHHETLFWISGRPDLLSGAAVLLTLRLLDGARRSPGTTWRVAAASSSAFAAALLKETGLVVIPLAVAMAAVLSEGASRRRDVARAAFATLPAILALALYVGGATETFRLENALRGLPGRHAWVIPGLASLAWPISLDEVRTQMFWGAGGTGKWLGVPLSLVVLLALGWGLRRHAARPEVRLGVVLLTVGAVPFFLLPQHRLLYLASAGFTILIAAFVRGRATAVLAGVLGVAWLVGLGSQAVLWREATTIGRIAWRELAVAPEARLLLVDYPVDVGGVLGSTGGPLRLRGAKVVQYLAPLRVPRISGWSPSTISLETGTLRVARPVRWGDHFNLPCDERRMARPIAAARSLDCAGDASETIVAPWSSSPPDVGIYRFDGASFRRVALNR